MLRPLSPVPILFALVLLSAAPRAADTSADPQQPDPIVLTTGTPIESSASPDVVVETEEVAPAHEADHVAVSDLEMETDGISMDVGTADQAEAAGVCKDYGQICRKSRECCAPLHCAFDGYTHYCRY